MRKVTNVAELRTRLYEILSTEDWTTPGSAGQQTAHPLLKLLVEVERIYARGTADDVENPAAELRDFLKRAHGTE